MVTGPKASIYTQKNNSMHVYMVYMVYTV